MSHKKGQKVVVVDKEAVEKDEHLEEYALKIIKDSDFIGEVTKVFDEEEDTVYCVGFWNDKGWVTQGFRDDEIKEVK